MEQLQEQKKRNNHTLQPMLIHCIPYNQKIHMFYDFSRKNDKQKELLQTHAKIAT